MSQASDLVKILAIKYYEQGKGTQRETAETFEIDRRTFQRWYYKYKETGDLSRKSRSSKSYKIRKNHVKYALKIIKKYQSISIYNLWQSLQKEFTDFSITPQHLGVVIRDNNITRKRTSKRHYPETRYGKKLLKKTDNKLQMTVPYIPKTNAIETWFSLFKHFIRHFINPYN